MADLTVATTIFEQLGGRRFMGMTGASSFVGTENSLNFRFPKAKDGINHCKIVLTPQDDYDMEFSRWRGTTLTAVSKVEGVYADQLEEIFTDKTGLATRLY